MVVRAGWGWMELVRKDEGEEEDDGGMGRKKKSAKTESQKHQAGALRGASLKDARCESAVEVCVL